MPYHFGMAKAPKRVQIRLRLSAHTKAHIDREVESRGYSDAAAYIEACVAKDRGVTTLSSWSQLDGLLADAVASGPARPMTSRDWARLSRATAPQATPKQSSRSRRRSA